MSGTLSGDNPSLQPLGLAAIGTLNQAADGRLAGELPPDNEFPTLRNAADLPDAWAAANASNDPDGARDRLVRIAFNNGWEESLPAAARAWVEGRRADDVDSDLAQGRRANAHGDIGA